MVQNGLQLFSIKHSYFLHNTFFISYELLNTLFHFSSWFFWQKKPTLKRPRPVLKKWLRNYENSEFSWKLRDMKIKIPLQKIFEPIFRSLSCLASRPSTSKAWICIKTHQSLYQNTKATCQKLLDKKEETSGHGSIGIWSLTFFRFYVYSELIFC